MHAAGSRGFAMGASNNGYARFGASAYAEEQAREERRTFRCAGCTLFAGFVLIVAGNDTTTNLIANGAVLLARHPEQRALLANDPSRIPDAAEEMLRCESPAQQLPRCTARDVTLHGSAIPAGSECSSF